MTRQPSPYKGLASFDDSEHDALLFFGRERERDVIVANVLASRLTVLYGESGVGKSSVLRAGVVRELRRRRCGARSPPFRGSSRRPRSPTRSRRRPPSRAARCS